MAGLEEWLNGHEKLLERNNVNDYPHSADPRLSLSTCPFCHEHLPNKDGQGSQFQAVCNYADMPLGEYEAAFEKPRLDNTSDSPAATGHKCAALPSLLRRSANAKAPAILLMMQASRDQIPCASSRSSHRSPRSQEAKKPRSQSRRLRPQ